MMLSHRRYRDRALPAHRVAALLLLVFATLPSAPSANDVAEDAARVISLFHQSLLESMQHADQLEYQGRVRQLTPVISACFDLVFIARVILGRHWKTLSQTQQAQFTALFKQLTIATYAFHFDSYQGESFELVAAEPLKKKRLLIKTRLNRPRDQPVALNYLVHQHDGDWRIIGVIADGVNDLSVKRTEYGSIIKDRGMDGLFDALSGKIQAMTGSG